MRIGLLTQSLLYNYGGLLQNYALQQVLKRAGHEVETIDWKPQDHCLMIRWVRYFIKYPLSYLFHNIEKPHYRLTAKEQEVILRNTNHFIKQYINLCPLKVLKPDMFRVVDNRFHYDAYVVGSDQVWRPRYNKNVLTAMFLDFVKRNHVKRIAYAASFGTKEWEFNPKMTRICSNLIKRFDMVSVREKSGINLCKNKLNREAIHVIDPTLILNKQDYEQLVVKENTPSNKGNLFHYILDPNPEKQELIRKIADKINLEPFTVLPRFQEERRSKNNVKKHIEDCVYPPVTSWLRGFMDAKMVIVDSFHGAVFSIIFNKPFWVISNESRGNTRFDSLLSLLHLEDRLITMALSNKTEWESPINWDSVNKILQNEQHRCVSLLLNSLSLE